MDKNKINLLKTLYKIKSPSGKEAQISAFVQSKLDDMKINYSVDAFGQIYSLGKNPLISCHLDSVAYCKNATVIDFCNPFFFGNGNIGADDKNGIFLCLELLRVLPSLSFIFSAQEESGGRINHLPLKEIKAPFALVFDRKGKNNIVGTKNLYCCDDFEADVLEIAQHFGFSSVRGGWSDTDILSDYLPAINISCGYYKPHTNNEYSNINDIENTLSFATCFLSMAMRQKLSRYKMPEKISFDKKWLAKEKELFPNDWDDYKYSKEDSFYADSNEYFDKLEPYAKKGGKSL